ncbi:MAG: NUDIX domain-containing protein [Streptosporangiales bacterium]|nr:NUDIX domain-containing protein [Streptosporangiales bacterium]
MKEAEPRERLAGRVIVLDPDGRTLLFEYDDPEPNGHHWNTPGGGLEAGEDYLDGARRELAEETGWHDVPVLPGEVHRREIVMMHAKTRMVRQVERFFLARVREPRRPLGDVGSMHVTDGIGSFRWWTLEELEATADRIWPEGLADLVRRLR